MKENSLIVQILGISGSLAPAVYVSIVHYNLLESIFAYIIILGLSAIVFKKWFLVLNVATFLTVLTLVILIGGTL